MLADFEAMGYRQQKQQARLIAQERATAGAQMAHQLAHEFSNPLQSMTNASYLIAKGTPSVDAKALGGGPLHEHPSPLQLGKRTPFPPHQHRFFDAEDLGRTEGGGHAASLRTNAEMHHSAAIQIVLICHVRTVGTASVD
jgi:hypothetical protein